MAMIHGKNGKVVWNAEDGASDVDFSHITAWAFDANCELADSTNMASTNDWREYMAGQLTWTASADVNYAISGLEVGLATVVDNQGLADDNSGVGVGLELWLGAAAASGIYYGYCVATGIAVTCEMSDVMKVTYTFQGVGALAYIGTEPVW